MLCKMCCLTFGRSFSTLLLVLILKESSQLPSSLTQQNFEMQSRKPTNQSENLSPMDVITDVNLENDLTDLFEGDIDMKEEGEVVAPILPPLPTGVQLTAQRNRRYLWHSGFVPYQISSNLKNFEGMIEGALQEISSKTCIKFVKRTVEDNWIHFIRGSGCWSSVGRLYWRPGFQVISLGNGCLLHETVLHEVLHALGFWHEQSRPDRDEFIEIFWENIEKGEQENFRRHPLAEADLLGVQYDYSSVMHYGSKAFSKNGKVTMKAIRDPSKMLGMAMELSPLDAVKLNALYDCQNSGGNGWSSWSEYGPCSSDCFKQRQRFCKHSSVSSCEGANEFGVQTETLECKKDQSECYAPINGNWSPWGAWSVCSVSCDKGVRSRIRECTDPAPKYDGSPCKGSSADHESCKTKSCNLGENDCEFHTHNLCHWQNDVGNNEKYDWLRISGPTPSRKTGPDADHTSGSGHYIYLEASSPAKQGYKGRLLSRIFKHGMTKCLVFYYFMYGSDMGTLRVLLYGIRSNAKEVLWQTSGDKGHKWKEQAISVRAEEDFKIVFEGERGIGFKGDIAIDDVYIEEGPCRNAVSTSIGQQNLVITTKKTPHVIAVGCYKDVGPIDGKRPFPQFVNFRDRIDWDDISKTISECATKAKDFVFKFFAVQFYGECWFGPESEVNYSRDGLTSDCWNGVGKAHSMMVYKWETS